MSRGRILVVEDNPDTRALVSAILEMGGYSVQLAKDGAEGLDLIISAAKENNQFSAVILDILMPKMNGLELLQTIKEHEATSQLPVLMLTTKDMAEDLIKGYSLGADYYIPKPFTSEQIYYGLSMVLDDEVEVSVAPDAELS